MKLRLLEGLLSLAAAGAASAQEAPDTTPKIAFGAFIDGYYAYDTSNPGSRDRAFTTQASRHNEFDTNLIFIEAAYSAPRVRARLALQSGTSVQFNYAGEPDAIAGTQPNYLPLIQEATVGVRISPSVWVDGGIFFSHIGSESWISADNPTYTRSLPAEFSPYYEAGVRATWQAAPALAAQLNVVNGWQIVTETNDEKAAGVRLDYTAGRRLTLSYYNFFGEEIAAFGEEGLRFFNGVAARLTPNDRTLLVGTFDIGTQEGDTWYGASLVGRYQFRPTLAVNGRLERFDDPDGVVALGLEGLQTNGASIGIDVISRRTIYWRTELRSFFDTRETTFPTFDGTDTVLAKSNTLIVTSLAIRF